MFNCPPSREREEHQHKSFRFSKKLIVRNKLCAKFDRRHTTDNTCGFYLKKKKKMEMERPHTHTHAHTSRPLNPQNPIKKEMKMLK